MGHDLLMNREREYKMTPQATIKSTGFKVWSVPVASPLPVARYRRAADFSALDTSFCVRSHCLYFSLPLLFSLSGLL